MFDIPPLPTHLDAALQQRIDAKTKPLGALGRLEALALQAGRVLGTLTPRLQRPQVLVFAGDHGLAREGVSAYPQDVTWQMVMNFLAGGAAVNVLAREAGLAVTVVDAGVNHRFAPHPGLVDAKVRPGTRNSLHGPAMAGDEAEAALQRGAALARQAHAAGSNVLAFGEMGIGNTSAAALLLHKIEGVPLAQAVGRGTGLDDAGLARKHAVLARAAQRTPARLAALPALAEYGGYEIAMMAGAMLGAAQCRALVLVDGFIASAALLVAARLQPQVLAVCIHTHRSQEAGHAALLAALGARPLLDLDLRLGEGSGAVLAYPLLRAAVACLNDMASFDAAGVAQAAPPADPS